MIIRKASVASVNEAVGSGRGSESLSRDFRGVEPPKKMTAARDHKNLHILSENSAGESAVGVTYLSMRIHPKSYHIFPLKVSATLLNDSRKGTIGA